MKSCPTCKRTYADESLTFCLVDGAILSAPYDPQATQRIPAPRDTDPPPTEILNPTSRPSDPRPPLLSTIHAAQPTPLYTPRRQAPLEEKQSGKPWLMIGIAISLVLIFVVGAILSIIWFGKADDNQSNSNVPNTNVRPTSSPTATTGAGGWGPRNDHASLNGESLTYYPGTTPEQCQADCDKNDRCKGFTFIRAGAYNPNDSAMCYLVAVATEMVSHSCCISAIKRPNNNANANTTASKPASCFGQDVGAASTKREEHYSWAQQRDANVMTLAGNLMNKSDRLFHCPGMSEDSLSSAFADISVAIARYVPDPNCFSGDTGVTSTDRAGHKDAFLGHPDRKEKLLHNLNWKMSGALHCLDQDKRSSYFADVSVLIAKAAQ